MFYFTTKAQAKKAAKAGEAARKAARKAAKARKAARKVAKKAALRARQQEVRTKNIGNKLGTPPPDVGAPGTRFDVNYYSSGPSYIRDIGVIEKRKK